MPATAAPALQLEWITLQNNYEQYEKSALLIKLTGIVLCALSLLLARHQLQVIAVLSILWIQEGIFRTYQSRLGERILRIENHLAQSTQTEGAAFQLHSEWMRGRPGISGLIKEYVASTLKPTVAFPHAALLVTSLIFL